MTATIPPITPLETDARNSLKTQAIDLSPKQREMIKLIYGRAKGKRSVEDAKQMSVDEVIDEISYNMLPSLQRLILNTVNKQAK